MILKNFFTFDLIDMVLIALALLGIYAIIVVGISSMKQVEIKEAKRIFFQDFLGFFSRLRNSLATEIQLSQGDIADIVSAIAGFSSIQMENTKWNIKNLSAIPELRVEILDSNFPEHFGTIQKITGNILERIFACNSVTGAYLVTYERTFEKNLYTIAVYWATVPESKKALEQKRRNIAEYGRRMEIEKSAPFVDRELDREMENLED